MHDHRIVNGLSADEALRQRIIDVAEQCFLTVGYSRTTSQALASKLGISKKTLYRVFGGKEDILRAVVQRIMDTITDQSEPLYNDHLRPASDRIMELMALVTKQYARLRTPRILDDLRRNAPDVWNAFQEWRVHGIDRFELLLTDGIAQHQVRNDITVTDMVSVYHAMLNACMDYVILSDGTIPPERIYHTFMDIFFQGMLVPDRHAS
jgi:AcrR family transcriptional regulator